MTENDPESATPNEPVSPRHTLYGESPRPRQQRKKTLGTWLWPVIILVAVVLGVVFIIANNHPASSRGGGRRGGGGDGPTPVSAVTATLGDLPIYIDALGTVTPTATVTVHTQVSGQLQTVAFTEGQLVTKGQFLAQVDPRPYQAALMQAQGNLAKDQAQLSAAKVDLNRYRTLLAQDSISSQQVDTQAATVGQLEGAVEADQAQVNSQQLNVTYAHIVAPISGRVGLRQVDAGNYVTSGDSNGIVAITQESPIDVAFTLPEDKVQQVTARFAKAKLPVAVLDRDQNKTLANGTLLSLDNLIDTTTGTLRAKAEFANTDGTLFPSQFVNVRILVDTMHNVVIVPSAAILRGSDGLFVYVADSKGAVHVTPVQAGPADGENTAILSGVHAGDKIVTDGTDHLYDGACVAIGGGGRGGSGGGKSASATDNKPGFFANLFGGGSSSASAGGGKGGKHASACGGGAMAAASGTEASASGGHHHHDGGSVSASGSDAQAPSADAGSSSADNGGHQGGGHMQAVLAQLNLTPDQQAKIDAILAAARAKTQGSDDPDARHAAMKAAMQQVNTVLTPDQQARLQSLRAASDNGTAGQQ